VIISTNYPPLEMAANEEYASPKEGEEISKISIEEINGMGYECQKYDVTKTGGRIIFRSEIRNRHDKKQAAIFLSWADDGGRYHVRVILGGHLRKNN
jgi:hypothetical protein